MSNQSTQRPASIGGTTVTGEKERKCKHKNSRSHQLFHNLQNDLVAGAGEFIATVLFLLFAFMGVQVITTNLATANNDQGTGTQATGSDAARLMAYYYISTAFAVSLLGVSAIFYRATGSLMSPNVGLALCLVKAITPVRFVITAVAQIVGSIVAAALADGLTPGQLAVGVALNNGTSLAQGLFIEMFASTAFVLAVLFIAAEKSALTSMAPLLFSFTLWSVEMASVTFTGGAVNTARAFGPAVISGFGTEHWIYWVGPTLGSLLATAIFVVAKHYRYWQVNPNQISEDPKHAPLHGINLNDVTLPSVTLGNITLGNREEAEEELVREMTRGSAQPHEINRVVSRDTLNRAISRAQSREEV